MYFNIAKMWRHIIYMLLVIEISLMKIGSSCLPINTNFSEGFRVVVDWVLA
jgi:hypothetical protein